MKQNKITTKEIEIKNLSEISAKIIPKQNPEILVTRSFVFTLQKCF